jgi:hypothetical protein
MPSVKTPIAMPQDLLAQVRMAAKKTGLTQQDAIRKSIKFGLPTLMERLAPEEKLKPFTKEEARRAFAPDAEWGALAAAMCKVPPPVPEE